ncbi:UNVERIFIED_CONTAM: Trafficking protein particle complex II-specific subunit [Sesamum angustifolium]|uniref:Trafficking protein particle complex II-specific subunit n=1 Tax=Sesamum angustifolium TaxID=2727405 RepID=A0AAW2MAC8_9LAMI
MEPDASIETSSMIRVAVLPIAGIPPLLFRDYAAMLLRHHTVSSTPSAPSTLSTRNPHLQISHGNLVASASSSSSADRHRLPGRISSLTARSSRLSAFVTALPLQISVPSLINSLLLVRVIHPHSFSDALPSAQGIRSGVFALGDQYNRIHPGAKSLVGYGLFRSCNS